MNRIEIAESCRMFKEDSRKLTIQRNKGRFADSISEPDIDLLNSQSKMDEKLKQEGNRQGRLASHLLIDNACLTPLIRFKCKIFNQYKIFILVRRRYSNIGKFLRKMKKKLFVLSFEHFK